MDIDYDSYLNMPSSDLSKIIEHAQNILKSREDLSIEAIKKQDLTLFKESQKINPLLSDDAWSAVEMRHLDIENIAFFETLEEVADLSDKPETKHTFTENLLYQGFSDVKILQYIYQKPHLKTQFENLIHTQGAWIKNISDASRDFLLDKKTIVITSEFLDLNLEKSCYTYFSYALKHQLIDYNSEYLKQIYIKHWSSMPRETLNLIQHQHPEYFNISAEQLVNGINVLSYSQQLTYDKYKLFAKLSDNKFSDIIEHHPLSSQFLKYLIPVIHNIYPQSQDKFMSLTTTIYEQYPDLVPELKHYCETTQKKIFKDFTEKVFLNASLNVNLPMNENISARKIKI